MEKIQILELRILPPIAIGRLGSSENPMDAYTLTTNEERPLDFRTIDPKESFLVDPNSGELTSFLPEKVIFKEDHDPVKRTGIVRPVAPFLEVYAVTSENDEVLVPLTIDLLNRAGYELSDLAWNIDLANIKLFRRTNDIDDKIEVSIEGIQSHERRAVLGECPNFLPGKKLPLGHVQYVKPRNEQDVIRFRYTPGPGKVYGSSKERINENTRKEEPDPLYIKYGDDFLIYDKSKDWFGYAESGGPTLTNPGMIFAGYNSEDGNTRFSWGYLDDECDGFAEVELRKGNRVELSARAHISAGPPAYAPDTLPVRVVSDELEQILLGPEVDKEVPIEEAEEIVRRALETVRIMNTAIMNGNAYNGNPRIASTMAAQDANDFGRMYEPIMAPSIVDNLAVQAIHERVFNGIGAGMAPWFENALRRPDKIGDLGNEERRKMPALMRGADGRALCFTHRQINTIIQCAASAMFQKADRTLNKSDNTPILKSDLVGQLHHRGTGNPFAVLPRTAISNCFPGLEFDFRNTWRRAFKGLLLLENNNYVLDGDGPLNKFKGHRLVGLEYTPKGAKEVKRHPISVPTSGPTLPNSPSHALITAGNPNGVSFMEWSNNLVEVLQLTGQEVIAYFTAEQSSTEVVFKADELTAENKELISERLTVNAIFETDTAAFNETLIEPGELTQGLCAPWQNDYRECACYYWAASRPDYVNVEPDKNGVSKGDNWMAKKRSGEYIPDDRTDSRLVSYDDLFENWEGELNFIVKGKDALDSDGNNSETTGNPSDTIA